jgi:glyoxylase I family protein
MAGCSDCSFVFEVDDTRTLGRQNGAKMAKMRPAKFLPKPLEQREFNAMGKAPFEIKGLDHIVLRVCDRGRMLRFYCDILGCTMEREQAEIGLFQVRAGSSLIDLVPVDGKLGRMGGAAPGKEGRNLDHFCITLDGYDEAEIRAYLRAHGVEIGEAGSRYGAEGEGPSLYISDPEGNIVELKGPPWSDQKQMSRREP